MNLGKAIIPFALAGIAVLAGCADKNSAAAKSTDVQTAIDGGNYVSAISTLQGQCPVNATTGLPGCPDQATTQQLGSAYMGAAGLNFVNLAKAADTTNTAGTNTSSKTNFSTVSSSLPTLDSQTLGYIAQAVGVLQSERISLMGSKPDAAPAAESAPVASCPVNYTGTDSQKNVLMQLGVAEAVAGIEAIGVGLGVTTDSNGLPVGTFDPATGYPAICQLPSGKFDCGDASVSDRIKNQLLAAYTAPAGFPAGWGTTYGDFAAYNFLQAAYTFNCAFNDPNNVNSTAQTISNLAYSIQTAQCSLSGNPPAGYTPNITGAQVATFITQCLR